MTRKNIIQWMLLGLLSLALVGCGKEETASAKEAEHAEEGHAHKEGEAHGGGHEGEHAEEAQSVELTPEQMRDIKIAVLEKRKLSETVKVPAELRFNERNRVVVTARTEGRVERVAVFSNQPVQKGQLLAELYSPEFLSAQQEYLLIVERAKRRAGDDSASLLSAATQRLRLLGLTEGQIEEIGQSGKVRALLPISSPIGGTVIEHSLAAGDAIESGKSLYVIADLSTVWVDLALTETQLAAVRPGQSVTLSVQAYSEKRFRGQILSIESQMDEATRTVKARAQVDNSARVLRPGMFAEAEVSIGAGKDAVLAVPKDATVRNPDGDWAVFIEDEPNLFKPVEVKIVRTIGDNAVIDGIAPGSRVVTQGAFFLQSELGKSGFDAHAH